MRLDFELKGSISARGQPARDCPKRSDGRLPTACPRARIDHQRHDHPPSRHPGGVRNPGAVARASKSGTPLPELPKRGIRGKAESGFKIYARSGDSNRIRRRFTTRTWFERFCSMNPRRTFQASCPLSATRTGERVPFSCGHAFRLLHEPPVSRVLAKRNPATESQRLFASF